MVVLIQSPRPSLFGYENIAPITLGEEGEGAGVASIKVNSCERTRREQTEVVYWTVDSLELYYLPVIPRYTVGFSGHK